MMKRKTPLHEEWCIPVPQDVNTFRV